MNAALLPLIPNAMSFRRRPFRILKDRHLYDTEDVATTDISKEYFRSTQNKRKSQAVFTGDYSLVKEANVFLVWNLQVLVRDRALTRAEWQSFYNRGFFKFEVIVPETVLVDEDRISAVSPGPDYEQFLNTADHVVAYGRTYNDRRTYLVRENKVVPGGRAIEFTLNWQEPGGNGLLATTSVSVVMGGAEFEPGSGEEK